MPAAIMHSILFRDIYGNSHEWNWEFYEKKNRMKAINLGCFHNSPSPAVKATPNFLHPFTCGATSPSPPHCPRQKIPLGTTYRPRT